MRTAIFAITGLAAAAAIAARPAPAAAHDPRALLDAAKAASGGAAWDRIGFWHERDTVTAGGLSGTAENWYDFRHVLAAGSYRLGPASGSQGWDGKAAWSTDSSGQVRVEASDEAVAAAIQSAYLATAAYFWPERWPATMSDAGTRTADGVSYDAIKVTPRGAEPVEIWFDPATHLIAREVQLTGAQPQTFLMQAYRIENGVRVPGRTVIRVGGNAKFDQVADIVEADLPASLPPARFAPPPPPPYDASFPAGVRSVSVPFRLINNHIYVMASVDGHPPAEFMFDTGASNFLDATHARGFGLRNEGSLPGGGFGSAIAPSGLTKARSVAIGGMTLHDQVFLVEDSSAFNAVEGEDGAGLLGYEFAKRAVITIDYAQRRMTLTRPDAFHPPPEVPPIPFVFDEHIPMVRASVDGIEGEFEIDTGARSALTLMHPFAEAHGLAQKYHATHVATTGYGVGGPSRALLARVDELRIGPVAIRKPVTDLVSDTGGAAAAARTAGNIGGDILKRFTVTLDYGHQVIYLQPNALAAQPDVFDRSGLWIARAPDGAIAIADVSADSAASAAGLATGDEILAVDGKPARAIALHTLREAFKAAPGTRVRLTLRGSGGATRQAVLVLKDQV